MSPADRKFYTALCDAYNIGSCLIDLNGRRSHPPAADRAELLKAQRLLAVLILRGPEQFHHVVELVGEATRKMGVSAGVSRPG